MALVLWRGAGLILKEADDVIPERSGAYEPKSLRGEIAFDRVEFGYGKDAPVLRGVSLSRSSMPSRGRKNPCASRCSSFPIRLW